jgi:GxxExxY protein
MFKMLHEQITKQIIGCAMQVHRNLGNGFQESIYQRALAIEFEREDLSFQGETEIYIYYREQNIGTRRVDFLVANKVMVEIKPYLELDDLQLAQTMNYLEAFKMQIGLLISFGGRSLEFKRVHNNKLNNEEIVPLGTTYR